MIPLSRPILEGKELSKWVNMESVQQLVLFKSKWTKEKYGSDLNEADALKLIQKDFPKLLSHILPLTERAKNATTKEISFEN